jgi:hypothetical protein
MVLWEFLGKDTLGLGFWELMCNIWKNHGLGAFSWLCIFVFVLRLCVAMWGG